MTKRALFCFSILLLFVAVTGIVQARPDAPLPEPGSGLVYVSLSTRDALDRFERSGLPVYARLYERDESYVLTGVDLSGDAHTMDALAAARLSARVLDVDTVGTFYYLVYPMPGYKFSKAAKETRFLSLRLQKNLVSAARSSGFAELRALTLEPKPLRLAPSTRTFPAVITPDPLIQSMISQVESTAVYSYTGDLTGEWPVEIGGLPYTITTRNTTYSGGQSLQKATQFVGGHLADLGLNVEYHTWDASSPPNVIGELPGVLYPDEIVIICAHLDDLSTSDSVAPGADDNASGSVGVLVAADILSQYQWAYTLRFALWTGEEQGLLGSGAYAQRASNSGENIVGVLNLDMIGWNTPFSSPDIDLHADSTIPSTLDLANLFADVVDAYGLSLVPEIVPNGTGASDHASFWNYGYTAILGIEDFSDFNPNYHTTNDLLAYLDMPYYTDLVKASVGTFAHMGYPLGGIGYLGGTVSSVATGDPISGAAVAATLTPTMTWSTTTGAGGVYQLKVISGTYTVTVAAPGYVSTITTGITVQMDQTSTLDVALAVTGPCTPVSGIDFDYDPLEPLAGDEVVFAGSAMEGTAELPITYTWDFGDERGVGAGNPITHTFPLTVTTQTYTVTLTVANGCPSQRAAWKTVTVQAGAKVYLPFVVRNYR